MASKIRIDVEGNAQSEVKKTAQEVKNLGQATKSAGETAKVAGETAARAAAGQTVRWIEASRAIDDFVTVLSGGGGFGAALRGAANNLSTMAATMGPIPGVLTAIGVNLGSIVIPKLWEAVSTRDELEGLGDELERLKDATITGWQVAGGDAITFLSGLVGSAEDAEGALTRFVDAVTPGDLQGGLDVAGFMDGFKEILEGAEERKKQAEKLIEDFHKKERDEAAKSAVERIGSIEAVDRATKDLIATLEEASRKGGMSDQNLADAESRLKHLSDHRKKLLSDEAAERAREQKRAADEEERAARELAHKKEEHARRLAQAELAFIEAKKRADIQAAKDAMEAKKQLEEEARQLLEAGGEGLQTSLGGGDQSLRDIAKRVADQRAQAELERFNREDADPLGGAQDQRRRNRAVEAARRGGFRDVVQGRASEEEIAAAQQQNVQATIESAQSQGLLNKDMSSLLHESSRQLFEQSQEVRQLNADLAQVRQALKSSDANRRDAARIRQSQSGSLGRQ